MSPNGLTCFKIVPEDGMTSFLYCGGRQNTLLTTFPPLALQSAYADTVPLQHLSYVYRKTCTVVQSENFQPYLFIHLSVSAALSSRFCEQDVFMQQTRTIRIFSIKSRCFIIFIAFNSCPQSLFVPFCPTL